MAVRVVYQARAGDGYNPAYVELIVDSAADLEGVQVSVHGTDQDPAAGSVAYTPGADHIWHCKSDGSWAEFQ